MAVSAILHGQHLVTPHRESLGLARSRLLSPHSLLSLRKQNLLSQLRLTKLNTHKSRSFPLVFAAQSNFFRVIQTAWKVARDGIDAGTSMVPDTVPRPIARITVTIVGLAVAIFVLKSFLSTAFFVLATMGLVYFAFIALYKDEGPKGVEDKSFTKSSTNPTPTTSDEDALDEARRIMEKYK